jgi:hypothetical protein
LLLEVVRAVIARTLIDGTVGTLFPAVEGAVAVRTPVTSRAGGTMAASEWRQALADFTAHLAGLAAIVEVKELRGCVAVGAATSFGQAVGATSANRRQRPAMLALILSTQQLPVQAGRGWRWGGRLRQRRAGIDVEVAIVRMLLAEVVAGLRLGLTSGEDLLQLFDKVLQILASKFPAEPKYQSWYAAHSGESLGNRGGFPDEWFGKERLHRLFYSPSTPTAEAPVRLQTEPLISTHKWTPAHWDPRGRKQKCRHLPRIQQNIGLKKESF